MYLVYVIQNTLTSKIYIGQTSDLEKRLARHNGNLPSKAKSFTSKNLSVGEWRCVYKEPFESRSEALKREKELKSSRGRNFLRKYMGR